VLIVPDVYGITTTLVEAAIRFAREGFEVLTPDLGKTDGIAAAPMLLARGTARFRGGVDTRSAEVTRLVRLLDDALDHLLSREMVDPSRTAVFGTSFGASVALAFAAQSPRLSAAVLAYPLPVRPAGLPGLITVPTLCITGSRDRVAARSTAQFRASTASPAPSVVEVAGARHHFLSRDLGGYELGPAEEAWQTIVVFLKGQLMPPPPPPPAPPIKPADPLAVPRTTSPPRSPSPGPSAT
jgi:dienelactone hydrolase